METREFTPREANEPAELPMTPSDKANLEVLQDWAGNELGKLMMHLDMGNKALGLSNPIVQRATNKEELSKVLTEQTPGGHGQYKEVLKDGQIDPTMMQYLERKMEEVKHVFAMTVDPKKQYNELNTLLEETRQIRSMDDLVPKALAA